MELKIRSIICYLDVGKSLLLIVKEAGLDLKCNLNKNLTSKLRIKTHRE